MAGFCTQCGTELFDGQSFCTQCGTPRRDFNSFAVNDQTVEFQAANDDTQAMDFQAVSNDPQTREFQFSNNGFQAAESQFANTNNNYAQTVEFQSVNSNEQTMEFQTAYSPSNDFEPVQNIENKKSFWNRFKNPRRVQIGIIAACGVVVVCCIAVGVLLLSRGGTTTVADAIFYGSDEAVAVRPDTQIILYGENGNLMEDAELILMDENGEISTLSVQNGRFSFEDQKISSGTYTGVVQNSDSGAIYNLPEIVIDSSIDSSSDSNSTGETGEAGATGETDETDDSTVNEVSLAPSSENDTVDDRQAAWLSYYHKIEELTDTYGQSTTVADEIYGNRLEGLCLVRLYDFNDDGIEELVTTYYDSSQTNSETINDYPEGSYITKVWSYDSDTKSLVEQFEGLASYTNGGMLFVEFTADEAGQVYLKNTLVEYTFTDNDAEGEDATSDGIAEDGETSDDASEDSAADNSATEDSTANNGEANDSVDSDAADGSATNDNSADNVDDDAVADSAADSAADDAEAEDTATDTAATESDSTDSDINTSNDYTISETIQYFGADTNGDLGVVAEFSSLYDSISGSSKYWNGDTEIDSDEYFDGNESYTSYTANYALCDGDDTGEFGFMQDTVEMTTEVLTQIEQGAICNDFPEEIESLVPDAESDNDSATDSASLDLSNADDYLAVNIFLSNFSELNMGELSSDSDIEELVRFAIFHCGLNSASDWESKEDASEYSDVGNGICNIRISSARVDEIIQRYFGFTLDYSELSDSESFFYQDDYIYFVSTNGILPAGVALAYDLESLGNNRFEIDFNIYSSGDMYDVSDQSLYSSTPDELMQIFGVDAPYGTGTATVQLVEDSGTERLILISYEWSRD